VADHLETLRTTPPHIEGVPVGTVAFDEEISALLQKLEEQFAGSEVLGVLRRSYSSGEFFGAAFGKLYARLFAEFGLVLLDPSDPDLHRIAQPVYSQALAQWKEINRALQQREQELEAAGYHAQVKVTPSHTLCFCLQEGVRTPVRHDGEGFVVGESKFSDAELIALAQASPERFNPNVLLRPIVQDYLLPTLCYAGGPAEIAYFAQVEVVYRKLLGRVTPVVPRIFATLVEPRQAKLLDRYEMKLTDIFHGPEQVREMVATRALPEGIMKGFDQAGEHLEQALSAIRGPLQKLDPTLADAAENAGSKMRYQLQGLRDKAARAEARKNTETQRHADELSTLLYPNKDLQEREIGGIYFLLKHGMALLPRLKESLKTGCTDHQVVRL
jgi:bacillithiol biosynthesis cysteine-adding enzyme BshC